MSIAISFPLLDILPHKKLKKEETTGLIVKGGMEAYI